MTDLEAKKILLTCSGDTILETLEEINLSPQALAEKLGCSLRQLNQLIRGEMPLSYGMANKLEKALSIPSKTWIELERMHQKELQILNNSPISIEK